MAHHRRRLTKAIAGKMHTRSRRVNCEAVNGLGRKPKTGAQAKQGQRRAGIVCHQGATTGASSNDGTVAAAQRTDDKDKQDGLSFDRNRLNQPPVFAQAFEISDGNGLAADTDDTLFDQMVQGA